MEQVVVLGAGPAGVGAALMLAKSGKARVKVLERAPRVGGNSGSFLVEGVHCDFGSHRLHPSTEPHLLDMIKEAVGPDLLWRPRHGRIRLKGRWIHFPLKPVDLLLRLPKSFTAQLIWDAATKRFRRAAPGEPTFASVLHQGLGPAMCENFYYPYMRKLWALPPEDLAVTLATRRVSGSSIGKILKKILGQIPGLKKPHTGGFYYPRKGFGQISDSLRSAGEKLGAEFALEASITGIEHEGSRVKAVRYQRDGVEFRIETNTVWSTLPLTTLASLMDPSAPAAVMKAASRVRYRGMILIYLVLEQDQFTEYDAHYFPEYAVPISRLSEPKNYSASTEPVGVTVLCAELPCDPEDELWALPDKELGVKLCEWLAGVGLPVTAKVRRTETRRLGYAYPVYDRGFEGHLKVLDRWVESVHGLLTFGRQGLFAHDNTHHALAMAHGAVDCLNADGSFDLKKWHAYRRVFETHVVED
ncbi:MAG: FAD-dependent oxidoreductase [Sphingomicrobium sp.]